MTARDGRRGGAEINEAQRRRLKRGQIRPDRSIDLHGLRAEEARRTCLAEIAEAERAGERCVLVVHGRGRSSPNGPVLREALPGWLDDPRLAGCVLAFARAQPDDGGAGASYVLLRRRRDR
jgi:DNA-nicking Smr family endonuclease